MGDDPKRLILARRAKFVAAALAGASAVATACSSSSKVCLSLAPGNPPDAGDDVVASPQPCLGVRAPEDGGPDAESDATDDAPDGD